ncbi:hypothetical protein [Caballeronia sp. 15711]|uniref:hypothetical protein n=1 Tax=Caballeronia sp. 15711 TaxID=3391029 RepID=UPI0039E2DAB8
MVPAILFLFNAHRHALAVDVRDLRGHRHRSYATRRVGDRQRGLVLQVVGRFDEAAYFALSEDVRQYACNAHRLRPDSAWADQA